MSPIARVLAQSVDGPYVLLDLDESAVAHLERARESIGVDSGALGLLGVVLRPPAGLAARFAQALTTESVGAYRRLFADPLNEEGPRYLEGFRVTRVHVFADSFWLYAVDDSDPSHLPEVVRSDAVPFSELRR